MSNAEVSTAADQAVAAFTDADTAYRTAERALLDGEFVAEILEKGSVSGGLHVWATRLADAQRLLEDRNAKLKNAQLAVRELVKISPMEERGPGAKATSITKGPFKVSSVTGRSFDVRALLDLAEQEGVLEELRTLSTNADGNPQPVLRQVWEVDYEPVLMFLNARKLEGVVNGAYKETEKTPAVTGPKPLAFFGAELKG